MFDNHKFSCSKFFLQATPNSTINKDDKSSPLASMAISIKELQSVQLRKTEKVSKTMSAPIPGKYSLWLFYSRKIFKRQPWFSPFTFSENLNCGQENCLRCQQTFENKKFVDIIQKCFAQKVIANNLNYH